MCLESIDLATVAPGDGLSDVSAVTLDADAAPRAIDGRVTVRMYVETGQSASIWPYGRPRGRREPQRDAQWLDVPLIAYHDWANRGPSTMRVWLPRA